MAAKKDTAMTYALCTEDTIKSVLQNVALIVSTIKGTSTMYREFGVRGAFIDKPPHAAKTLLASEIREAVEEFEPRAEVQDISFAQSGAAPACMNVTIKLLIFAESADIEMTASGSTLTITRMGVIA